MSALPYACLLKKYGLEIDQNDLVFLYFKIVKKILFYNAFFVQQLNCAAFSIRLHHLF